MIENLLLAKMQRKKEELEQELSVATGYKRNQLTIKLYELNE